MPEAARPGPSARSHSVREHRASASMRPGTKPAPMPKVTAAQRRLPGTKRDSAHASSSCLVSRAHLPPGLRITSRTLKTSPGTSHGPPASARRQRARLGGSSSFQQSVAKRIPAGLHRMKRRRRCQGGADTTPGGVVLYLDEQVFRYNGRKATDFILEAAGGSVRSAFWAPRLG